MVVIVILCLNLSINTGSGVNIPVYVGVNYDNPSTFSLVTLEANNYSIYFHTEGFLYGYGEFTIIRGSKIFFTITSTSVGSINDTIEQRLTLTELGDYNFTFIVKGDDSRNYLNYEVILVESEIIYHPKTSIISEVPYGFAFIVIALIGVAIVNSQRRNRR